MTFDVVVQRAAFAQRHAYHRALGGLGRLADRFRHLARFAVAEADAALLVADDHERGEAEAAPALDDLGDAVDVHELVDDPAAVTLFALAFTPPPALQFRTRSCSLALCHPRPSFLEFQSACARRVGERLDAPVIEI